MYYTTDWITPVRRFVNVAMVIAFVTMPIWGPIALIDAAWRKLNSAK